MGGNGINSVNYLITPGTAFPATPAISTKDASDFWRKAGNMALKAGMGGGAYQVAKAVTTPGQREKSFQKIEELGPFEFLKFGLGLGAYSAIKGGAIIDQAIGRNSSKEAK